MANTAQSEKRARQSEKRRLHNQPLRSRFRTEVRKAREIAVSGNAEEKKKIFISMQSMIDRTVSKNILSAGTAARIKSRLNKAMRKTPSAQQPIKAKKSAAPPAPATQPTENAQEA